MTVFNHEGEVINQTMSISVNLSLDSLQHGTQIHWLLNMNEIYREIQNLMFETNSAVHKQDT